MIGLSVKTWDDVERAQGLDCDSSESVPVFATPTKRTRKNPGSGRARQDPGPLAPSAGRDAAAIRSNADAAVTAGADCVAVVSAICAAADPYAASRELADIISLGAGAKKRPPMILAATLLSNFKSYSLINRPAGRESL